MSAYYRVICEEHGLMSWRQSCSQWECVACIRMLTLEFVQRIIEPMLGEFSESNAPRRPLELRPVIIIPSDKSEVVRILLK